MRAWSLLLLVSCTTPNEFFQAGLAGGDATDVTATSSTPTTTSTTSTTTESASTGTTRPTTATSDTTGTPRPACPEFANDRILVDPPLMMSECEKEMTYYGRVTKPSETEATAALCFDSKCEICGPIGYPLDPGLVPYVTDNTCLALKHRGIYSPADPEATGGCKTTELALYNDDTIYPVYVASSRIVHAPAFIDPDVTLDVERGTADVCTCENTDCCFDDQASSYTLDFTYQGAFVATLEPGGVVQRQLKEVTYLIQVLRAHSRGYVDKNNACVDSPETNFVDWHMIRLFP